MRWYAGRGVRPAPRTFLFLLLALSLACVSVVAAQPANDNFANAFLLTGLPASGSSNSAFATEEPGEPDHEYNATDPGGASVWWTWIAPETRRVIVEVCGTNYLNPLLSVYTGNAVSALTRLPTVRHDGCGLGQARVIDVVAGTTYHIAVDGPLSFGVPAMGNIPIGILPAADNDDFANAAIISGASGLVTGANLLAGKETGEPDHSGNGSSETSIWWRWTAPFSGPVRVTTCDSHATDTFVAVYTGAP